MSQPEYTPDRAAFLKLAGKGNLVPVYREILADLETPVSAYLKIADDPYTFLLESVEGGEKWARYCFLGARRLGLVNLEVVDPERPQEAPAPGTLLPGGLVRAREGWVRLLEVKPEGKGAMAVSAFLNGAPDAVGRMLLPERATP